MAIFIRDAQWGWRGRFITFLTGASHFISTAKRKSNFMHITQQMIKAVTYADAYIRSQAPSHL
jgi:hypothetical protein